MIRRSAGLVGVLMLIAALLGLRSESAGIETLRILRPGNSPLTFLLPAGAEKGSRPLVLVAHGFAGSTVLMRSFAYPLVYAGYVVALWDFDGHGENPRGLYQADSSQRSDLLANAEAALAEAERQNLFDPDRVAILGHSMGSGVALSFGQVYSQTQATIAVSPVGTAVTASLPRNLLLMAGQSEAGFVRSAQQRLAEAGGEGGDLAAGTARRLVVIPLVEHITILFAPQAHQEARQWLDGTFGGQPGAQDHPARLVYWYGLGLLGALLAASMLVPATQPVQIEPGQELQTRPAWLGLLALAGGALAATLLLALAGWLGLPLPSLFGLLVGGYLLVWFAAAGLAALLILAAVRWPGVEWRRSGWRRPGLHTLGTAVLVFAFLWVGVIFLGGQVWLPANPFGLLIPERLRLWPLGILAFLPWFLAVGAVSARSSAWGRLGWWLAQSVIVAGALLLALSLSSGLGFLVLILPLFPLMLGFHALAASRQRSLAAFAVSAALFVSWMVLAVFPLG